MIQLKQVGKININIAQHSYNRTNIYVINTNELSCSKSLT